VSIAPAITRSAVRTPSSRTAVGIAKVDGFHHLRHFYASLLIHHGESVKVVQDRLGHSSATMTLDTYGHLWPDSEDSTRAAVDTVLGTRDLRREGTR
jgi:integrase